MGYITALTFVFLNFDELWEMNRSLFECGLRKSVELKAGRVYDITSTLEKTVKLSCATVKCKLTMNKTKKNTGDAKPLKQRRSIAKNRSSRTDKYPLASNLLLAKFKLRRAAGSKVSKLWFKRYEIEN